ncbi:pleckstrin homology-like domain family A member 2 [Octodon degus]|uniref:Pleckstrin homology-like domain family A member 2 n=1 Tax=Octodon degus TaxID=10160 RepID=A0A6P3F182_OCTDE|nr:pleckstrin homology-like domain family A member 2 [Octodon degus]
MKTPYEVIREGQLEKRSGNFLRLWKKKRGLLTRDRLRLFSSPGADPKELRFHSILRIDSVHHTSNYIYFTIVTDRRDFNFRCTGESSWNSAITMALIDFQNRRALAGFRGLGQYNDPPEQSDSDYEEPAPGTVRMY